MIGDIKYRDLNGDGLINDQDKTMISEYGRVPRIQYGFGGTLQWRKFDFGFQFTGSAQRRILISGIEPFREGRPSADAQNMLTWIADNCFDPEKKNFDAEYPRLGTRDVEVMNNTQASTYWMRDGSFLRLRNVELGWTFPMDVSMCAAPTCSPSLPSSFGILSSAHGIPTPCRNPSPWA